MLLAIRTVGGTSFAGRDYVQEERYAVGAGMHKSGARTMRSPILQGGSVPYVQEKCQIKSEQIQFMYYFLNKSA